MVVSQAGVIEGMNPTEYNPKYVRINASMNLPVANSAQRSDYSLHHPGRHHHHLLPFTVRGYLVSVSSAVRVLTSCVPAYRQWPLSKIRQPRVIAEVLGGILLGPSVLSRIPNFKETLFPPESMPNLYLVANLGLLLFLFTVGLEVNLQTFKRNWKIALSVGVCGITLPVRITNPS